MKVIVNSGNIGNAVAVELSHLGAEVVVAVRTPRVNPAWEKLGIRQTPFDLEDEAGMAAAMRGSDALFSLTPLVENLVEVTGRTVRAAKVAGIAKIVRASALGAGADARIELGRWHYAAEQSVAASGIPFTVIRPANFMQNFLAFGTPESIKAQNKIFTPLGEAKVSWVDTRDVAKIAAKLLLEDGHEGKRYELTGGEALSNADIAKILSTALGRTITAQPIPEAAATEGMAKGGMPPWLIALLGELNAVCKAGYMAAVLPDAAKLLQRPPTTFAQFVTDHLEKFQS